jgi:hypothetical protein
MSSSGPSSVSSRNAMSSTYRGGSVCLNSFGRFAKWDFRRDYAATIIGASALK